MPEEDASSRKRRPGKPPTPRRIREGPVGLALDPQARLFGILDEFFPGDSQFEEIACRDPSPRVLPKRPGIEASETGMQRASLKRLLRNSSRISRANQERLEIVYFMTKSDKHSSNVADSFSFDA